MSLHDVFRTRDGDRLECEMAALLDRQHAKRELEAMRLDPPPWRRHRPNLDLADPLHRRHWPHPMQAAYDGDEPADALPTNQRHALVRVLHREGFTDAEVAERLRLSTYTAARIRQAHRLAPTGDWTADAAA